MTTASTTGQPDTTGATGTSAPALVTGRFSTPDAGQWLLLGLAVLMFGASIKLLVVDRAADVAGYPALGGLAFGAIFTLLFLRSGTFTLTDDALSGRRRVGGAFHVPAAELVAVEYTSAGAVGAPGVKAPPGGVTVRRRSGAPIQLARVSPEGAPGALWLFVSFRALLPRGATLDGKPSALPRGVAGAERTLSRQGRVEYVDQGLLVDVAGQKIYLRTTGTGAPMGAGASAALMVGVVYSRHLQLGDAPTPASLPIHRLVEAILGADIPGEEKAARLTHVAAAMGGSRVIARGAELSADPISGYDVRLTPRA